jgi:hypothetical protein
MAARISILSIRAFVGHFSKEMGGDAEVLMAKEIRSSDMNFGASRTCDIRCLLCGGQYV